MRVFSLAVLLLNMCLLAPAGQEDLGEVAFANSGSAQAQQAFTQGMAALYSFWYDKARLHFHEARTLDPDFAMAYWGEAMSHHKALWDLQDPQAAREVMAALGSTPEIRLSKAPTPREKGFVAGLELLFGEGEKKERDLAFRDHMSRLAKQFPEDIDVAAFYALSILGTIQMGTDFREAVYAAALLEPFFAQHPRHPGVLHYLIHAYDDPIHAPLGLRAARNYARVAPGSAHALHMPSHIFVQMGMWAETVASNQQATEAALANGEPRQYDHASVWLHYGYLQQGRGEEARSQMDAYMKTGGEFSTRAKRIAAELAARYLVETGRWQEQESLGAFLEGSRESQVLLARCLAETFQAHLPEARAHLDAMKAIVEDEKKDGNDRRADAAAVRAAMAEAAILWMDHRWEEAEALLSEAETGALALGLPNGPPPMMKPVFELSGELLLLMDQPERALAKFKTSLERTPNRPLSLAGLALAAERTKNAEVAADALARLKAVWGEYRPGTLEEVRRVLEVPPPYTNLTHQKGDDRHPAWSPDGTLIAFESNREGFYQLYIMDPDGGNLRQLTRGNYESRGPSWAPDSKSLLFYANPEGNFDLFSMDLQGGNLKPLTRHQTDDRWGRFSPDGSQIAFCSRRSGHEDLFLMAADGGNLRRLTDHPQADLWPSWSPDGSRLAFFSRRDTGGMADELYLLDIATGEMERLTHHPTQDFCPAWSPDGKWLVWSGKRSGGRPELYALNLLDRRMTRLTYDGNGDTNVSWSPDGQNLVWAAYTQDGYDIVRMPFQPEPL